MKHVVLGLAMVAGMAGMAAGAGPLTTFQDTSWFIGEDFEGNVVIMEGPLDHNAVCSGFAPMVEQCTTGTHVRTGSLLHGSMEFPPCGTDLGVPSPSQVGRCYIGAVTSQLVHAAGARTFVCQIAYGPPGVQNVLNLVIGGVSCLGTGTFPPIGATFEHKCYSDDVGSEGAGNSGTGLGDWNCDIIH
ncbi:MAG: hypothetical protein ACRDHY_01865 [Anaerolineales bacterium]